MWIRPAQRDRERPDQQAVPLADGQTYMLEVAFKA
jgi:hypothetical protein